MPEAADESAPGARMYDWITELYPICRSLTGEGVRETLRAIEGRVAPVELRWTEVPTGTAVGNGFG